MKKNFFVKSQFAFNLRSFSFSVIILSTLIANSSVAREEYEYDDEAPSGRSSSGSSRGWKWGLGAGYSLASHIDFSNITVSGTTTEQLSGIPASTTVVGSGKANLDYENTGSFFVEARKSSPYSFGFSGGLSYDMERKSTSGNVTGTATGSQFGISGTSQITITVDNANSTSLQVLDLYGNLMFQFTKPYLFAGANYSLVNAGQAAGLFTGAELDGGVGYQYGLGYAVTDNFVVEVFSRSITAKMKVKTAGIIVDLGTGVLTNTLLVGKLLF